MQPNDRTYQFISDPAHKENLSGRVTAACLNCRRKKIKCSGETSCVQCQEKGLHCDGPPSRKRPRRDQGSSVTSETGSSKQSQTEQSASVRTPPLPACVPHEDSGYRSLQLGLDVSCTSSTISSPSNASETAATASYHVSTQSPYGYQHEPGLHVETASSREGHHGSMSSSSQTAASNSTSSPTFSISLQTGDNPWSGANSNWSLSSVTTGVGSVFQSYAIYNTMPSMSTQGGSCSTEQRGSSEPWWSSQAQDTKESPGKLIKSAEALEEQARDLQKGSDALEAQARDLRWLASRRHSLDADTHHNVAQFAKGTSSFTSQGQSNIPQSNAVSFASVSPTFEASTWFRPDGTLRSGFTPGVNDHISFLRQEPVSPHRTTIKQMATQCGYDASNQQHTQHIYPRGPDNPEMDGEVSPDNPGRSPAR